MQLKKRMKTAISLINGAIKEGKSFQDLEKVMTEAALAHYNDFGHSLFMFTRLQHYLLCSKTRTLTLSLESLNAKSY